MAVFLVEGTQPVYTVVEAKTRADAVKVATERKFFQGCAPDATRMWRVHPEKNVEIGQADKFPQSK